MQIVKFVNDNYLKTHLKMSKAYNRKVPNLAEKLKQLIDEFILNCKIISKYLNRTEYANWKKHFDENLELLSYYKKSILDY